MRKNGICFFGVLVMSVFLQEIATADIIYLQGGGKIEGEIIEETEDLLKVKIRGGMVTFKKSQIKSVEKRQVEEGLLLTDEELYKKRLTEINPTDPNAHFELGVFCLSKDMLDEARAEFKKVVQLSPEYQELAIEKINLIDEKKAQRQYNFALMYYKSKAYVKAKEILQRLIEEYPNTSIILDARKILLEVQKEIDKKGPVKSQGAVIVVPVDYLTLNEAINNAKDGDVVFIKAGTYNEDRIILRGPLKIEGEEANLTKLIIGNGGVQGVANEGNPLSNVTITKVWFDLKGAPIFLRNSKNIEFRDCIVTGANRGFYISESIGITIENCTIADLTEGINTGYGPIEVIIRDSIICNNKNYGIYVSNLTKTKMIIPINPYTGDKMTTETAEKETETKIQEAEQITKVSLYYNDVWNNVYNYLNIKPGEFDISQNPKFVGEGDYHLQFGSPCIDAGDPDPKYNDPNGTRNDLGALPYGRKR